MPGIVVCLLAILGVGWPLLAQRSSGSCAASAAGGGLVPRSDLAAVRSLASLTTRHEALVIERGRTLRDRIPVSEVVQVWRRKGSAAGPGAGYGAIFGAVLFGALGATAETTTSDSRELVFQAPPVVELAPLPRAVAWRSPD